MWKAVVCCWPTNVIMVVVQSISSDLHIASGEALPSVSIHPMCRCGLGMMHIEIILEKLQKLCDREIQLK